VARQLTTGPNGHAFTPPKSNSGKRSLILDDHTRDVLLAHADRRAPHLRLTATLAMEDLVFAQPDGTPLDPDKVYDQFQRLTAYANLPPIHLHGLRHGTATMALAAGVDFKTISRMLGHASVAFTMQTYGAVPDELQRMAAYRIAGLINHEQTAQARDACGGSSSRPRISN
jgi:integrase